MNKQEERTNLTLGFLRTAFKDYIAARVFYSYPKINWNFSQT